MKIHSRLPRNRYESGELWVTNDEGEVVFGPVRARGEADNTAAKKADNEAEDPTKPYGDHPYGVYRVAAPVVPTPKQKPSYGPFFIPISPVSGEAFEARQGGRSGFGIHGGKLHEDGRLRETFGCLRIEDSAATELAMIAKNRLESGADLFYECLPEE